MTMLKGSKKGACSYRKYEYFEDIMTDIIEYIENLCNNRKTQKKLNWIWRGYNKLDSFLRVI